MCSLNASMKTEDRFLQPHDLKPFRDNTFRKLLKQISAAWLSDHGGIFKNILLLYHSRAFIYPKALIKSHVWLLLVEPCMVMWCSSLWHAASVEKVFHKTYWTIYVESILVIIRLHLVGIIMQQRCRLHNTQTLISKIINYWKAEQSTIWNETLGQNVYVIIVHSWG